MSDWYYAANNEQKGPVNEAELKENFATHKLPVDTLVWKEGMDNWTQANLVPAFSFRQPPLPAKVQPTAPGVAPVVTSASPTANPASATPVTTGDIVGTPQALEVDDEDVEKNKVYGILAYLGILFLVPIFVAPGSPFAKYHANQGLVLFIGEIVLFTLNGIITGIFATLFSGFGIIGGLFSLVFGVLYLGNMVLVVLGIINAANGKCVPLPIIGGFKLLK